MEGSPDCTQEMVGTSGCCRILQTSLLLLGTFLSYLPCKSWRAHLHPGTCWKLTSKGAAGRSPQNQAPSPVNGMQGSSVLLQINTSLTGNMVDKIEWQFQPKVGIRTLTVAEFGGGKTWRPNRSDRFGDRLEALNETTIRIQDLQLEDAGVYVVTVRLPSAENEKHTFNLTVHQPVPEPQIRPQVASDTPSGCNVTLQCLAHGPGQFNVSWSPPSSLAGGPVWNQLSANGTDLQLFWNPSSTDSNVTCLVSSAVDQKGVSFDLRRICTSQGGDRTRLLGLCLSLGVVVPILAGVLAMWLWKKRRKKSPQMAFLEASPAARSPTDLQYAEIAMMRHPEGNEDQNPDCRSYPKYPTVYAQLMPLPSYEQVT